VAGAVTERDRTKKKKKKEFRIHIYELNGNTDECKHKW
jgi:hypothetical protein